MDIDFDQPYGFAMTDSSSFQPGDCGAATGPVPRKLEWRTRYGGHAVTAYVGDKAVAGISGPWSDKFALTWWDRPLPARQLELYDTLDAAKREVEDWALRMDTGQVAIPVSAPQRPGAAAVRPVAASAPGLFGRVRSLLPGFARPHAASGAAIERLRRASTERDTDLSGLHFGARE